MTFRKISSSQCTAFEAPLEDFLDGGLSLQEAWRVEQHLSVCGECRAALEMARQSGAVLRTVLAPAADPGAGFTQRVMTALGRQWEPSETPLLAWKPFEVLARKLALAAAFALVLLVAYGAGRESVSPAPLPAPLLQASRPSEDLLPGASAAVAGNDAVLLAIAGNDRDK